MAFADLGVRILLEDGASAGFNSLSLNIFGLFTRVGLLGSVWKKLPPQIKAAGMAAGAAGLLFGGLSDFLRDCIDAASQLQQEVANMTVSVNGASDAGSALSDTLINIADSSIYSTAIIADGFTTLGVDGWTATDLINGMGEAMAQFAEASRTDVVPAANLLGTTMETYGAKASDATQYTNDLTFALYNGQKTVANLQAAFNQVGGTAATLHLPFSQLADVLALLGEDGLKGTQAGSALRYMLTSLTSPTNKASKELGALGIVVINDNVPAFIQLKDKLLAAGGAAADSADQYDGTITSLQKMYTEAQKLGLLHTDESFYQWATGAGVLKDKLFDANGSFKGMVNVIEQLGPALDKLTPEQRAQALQQLFNVRGAQAAKLLLEDYNTTLQKLGNLDNIRKNTSAQKKAGEVTNTLAAQLKRLGSTWTDTMARLGSVDLGPLQGVADSVANLLHNFNTAPKQTRDFVGQLLVLATAGAGLVFIISAVVFIVGAFSGVLGTVIPVIAAVIGVIGQIVAVFIACKVAIENNKQVADIFHAIMSAIGGLLKNLGEQFQNLLRTLKTLEPVWNVLKVVLIAFGAIIGGIFLVAIAAVIAVFVALIWTINLVINVIKFLWNAFITGVTFAINGIKKFPQQVQQLLGIVVKFWTDMVNKVKKTVMDWINNIHQTIENGFNTVKAKIQQAINFVVGLFSWLYNHNYYFQFLVDFIRAKIAQIQAKFTEIKTFITTLWTVLWATVTSKLHQAGTFISNVFNQLKADVTTKFNQIKLFVTNLWNTMWNIVTSKVHEAWNNVTGAFNSAKGSVSNKINDIKNAILTPIKNLGQQLFDSAKNAMQMFINGLDAMLGKLKAKLGDIAGSVAKFLGFHSPPKEGPLADSDTYMPNMMKMFGEGIDKHKGLVAGKASDVATHVGKALSGVSATAAIKATGSVMTSAMTNVAAAAGSGGAGGVNQTITVPLVVDGQTLATVTLKQVGKQLQLNGINRQLR